MNVLVCIDEGEQSEAVLPAIARLAEHAELDLQFLRVLDPEAIRELSRASTDQWRRGLAAKHGLDGEGIVLFAEKPAEAILRYAAEEHADAIAMTTHARGLFAEVLHGSVAKAVVQHSPVPVMLIHPRDEARQ